MAQLYDLLQRFAYISFYKFFAAACCCCCCLSVRQFSFAKYKCISENMLFLRLFLSLLQLQQLQQPNNGAEIHCSSTFPIRCCCCCHYNCLCDFGKCATIFIAVFKRCVAKQSEIFAHIYTHRYTCEYVYVFTYAYVLVCARVFAQNVIIVV